MHTHEPILVPEGDSVGFTLRWTELLTETLEAPTSVTYQVFDSRTNSAVSTVQSVPDPAATMTFAIPPTHLPASGNVNSQRSLVVVIKGFFATNVHNAKVLLAVEKQFS